MNQQEVNPFIEVPERADTDGMTGRLRKERRGSHLCPEGWEWSGGRVLSGIQEPVRAKTRVLVLFLGIKGSWHGNV